MSQKPSAFAINEYFDELCTLIDVDPQLKNRIGQIVASDYSLGILFGPLAEMDSLHTEICQILDDFSGRQAGWFSKLLTVDQLILLIKFYVVQWSTLTDIMALAINKVFNLGLAERDVSFGLMLRNSHVDKAGISDLVKQHGKAIEYDEFANHRNEIIHRGRILDKDVLDLKAEWNQLHAKRYSLLRKERISDEEYEAGMAALNKKTLETGAAKQVHFKMHYEKTQVLISELLRVMARKSAELYRTGAIS